MKTRVTVKVEAAIKVELLAVRGRGLSRRALIRISTEGDPAGKIETLRVGDQVDIDYTLRSRDG